MTYKLDRREKLAIARTLAEGMPADIRTFLEGVATRVAMQSSAAIANGVTPTAKPASEGGGMSVPTLESWECTGCDSRYGSQVDVCPGCGAPIRAIKVRGGVGERLDLTGEIPGAPVKTAGQWYAGTSHAHRAETRAMVRKLTEGMTRKQKQKLAAKLRK